MRWSLERKMKNYALISPIFIKKTDKSILICFLFRIIYVILHLK